MQKVSRRKKTKPPQIRPPNPNPNNDNSSLSNVNERVKLLSCSCHANRSRLAFPCLALLVRPRLQDSVAMDRMRSYDQTLTGTGIEEDTYSYSTNRGEQLRCSVG
jgi:hypothetical protein